MKNTFMSCIAAALTALGVQAAVTDGVEPGEFTMDLDAAKSHAAEKGLPLLLNFSGSDWCGWCKIMDGNVFEQPEWKAYASNHVVTVLIDFPTDDSLVPEKYVARNEALSSAYGVEGFPTFVLLAPDGETEIGRLTAGREKTPTSFRAEIEALLRDSPAAIAEFEAGLSAEDREKFAKLRVELEEKEAEMKEIRSIMEKAAEDGQRAAERIEELEGEIKEFRVAARGPDALKAYHALKAEFDDKESELSAWLASEPENNPENMTKFESMRSELLALDEKLQAF